MHLSTITGIAGADRRPKRVGRGRGSGSGKTSGRGTKGAGARSGWRTRKLQEGGQMPIFRRVPKRGFNNYEFTVRYAVVNVGDLEERFKANSTITRESLLEVGLLRDAHLPLKILGTGDVKKKLTVEAAKFSASAAKKIESAGGVARVLG